MEVPLFSKYEQIYEEMMARNVEFLNHHPFIHDDQLGSIDDLRRCVAMVMDGTYHYSKAWNGLQDALKSILGDRDGDGDECEYESPTIHSTFQVLRGWKIELGNGNGDEDRHGDGYGHGENWRRLATFIQQQNLIEKFTITYNRIIPVKTGLVLCGYPSFDINSVRNLLRREGFVKDEPYLLDICHISLIRFTKPITSEKQKDLLAWIQTIPKETYIKLYVDKCFIYKASWLMRPCEIKLLYTIPLPTRSINWTTIQAIIFDLDGVLVDSRDIHYTALNKALAEIDASYVISIEEHLAKYDGLPTLKKLQLLTQEKGLDPSLYDKIWKEKQDVTVSVLEELITPNLPLRKLLIELKNKGYQLYCCSNSIYKTLYVTLYRLDILDLFEKVYSNDMVFHPKPHPQIYLTCLSENGLVPVQTLIIEDSPIGKTAATLSGAHVCPVSSPEQVTLKHLQTYLNIGQDKNKYMKMDTRWSSSIQVVIPMAGLGSRFSMVGYEHPKPLIHIHGKPMIKWVIDNLNLSGARYIFIVRKEHIDHPKWMLKEMLEKYVPGCTIVVTDSLTEGPACSVLLAEHELDPTIPLLIANSDQFLEWDANAFLYESKNVDGCISIFEQNDPNDKKWSYVKINETGMVTDVREKEPISTNASTGIYYWTKAGDFIKYTKQMIAKNIRVNNEFYVCPVYNEAILDGKKIKVSKCKKMWGLGVPADLDHFITNYIGIS